MFFADRKLHGSHTNLHNLSEHASENMKLSEHELNNRQVIEHALANQHACIPAPFQPRFYEYLYQHTYQSLRHIHLLGQLAFLLYFFADLFIIPDLALISGLTRVGVALGLWLISELLFRHSKDIRLLDMIMPIATTLCAGIWMIMLVASTSPHVANYLYASAIFLLIIHLSTKVQFKVSLYCSLFISLFVLITMTQIMTLSEAFTFAVVLIPILLFSVYMNWTNIINMRRTFLRTLLDEWNYHAVRKLAHTDDLTQLYNRRHFVNLAEHSIHEWPTPSSSCLLMFDVDHFKQINDNYGHDVGDRVLQVIAETTRKEMRHSDVLARFGGEEFIVLLSDTQLQDALLIAERIRHSIQRQHVSVHEDQPLQFTVSIGVAELESPSQSLDELIKQADTALYAAKRAGRNRIKVYRPEMESAPSQASKSLTS